MPHFQRRGYKISLSAHKEISKFSAFSSAAGSAISTASAILVEESKQEGVRDIKYLSDRLDAMITSFTKVYHTHTLEVLEAALRAYKIIASMKKEPGDPNNGGQLPPLLPPLPGMPPLQ